MINIRGIKRKIRLSELNEVTTILRKNRLHTICEEAKCPNISECMSKRRATFLILGDGCTRGCRFCSVKHYMTAGIDTEEATRVCEAVLSLGIKYAVITSVTRDDLPFGGAEIYRDVVNRLKEKVPEIKIELLIPDFNGDERAFEIISTLNIDVLNHNMETVKRLYEVVRPEADYERSLRLLNFFSKRGFFTKSGVILGFGETESDLRDLFSDLHNAGVKMLTIGQYFRPTLANIEVVKYYTDEEFMAIKRIAEVSGIEFVYSGRYVRSSYNAFEQYEGVNG
ncbi:MAG: lipoyl synthase [Myxococcota bacterium]